tara:strand:- start:462 stop:1169 length:708 start_codon:yes stop_codon:yes gene_type:complete
MKILILTTQTIHHAYFVDEIRKIYPETVSFIETKTLSSAFEIAVEFETRRDEYEKELWYNGFEPQITDLTETYVIRSINDKSVIEQIKRVKPDVTVVVGTGKLSKEVIETCGNIINLHGGNPEYYRGLDSHYWAIYHGDFKNLTVTLHLLNEILDDGNIIQMGSILIQKDMELYQLRRFNVELCVKLVLSALKSYETFSEFISRPQIKKGRYYSFMPACLKKISEKKFKQYVANL